MQPRLTSRALGRFGKKVPLPEKDYSGSSAGWWLWRHMTSAAHAVLCRAPGWIGTGDRPPHPALDHTPADNLPLRLSRPRISKHAEYGAGAAGERVAAIASDDRLPKRCRRRACPSLIKCRKTFGARLDRAAADPPQPPPTRVDPQHAREHLHRLSRAGPEIRSGHGGLHSLPPDGPRDQGGQLQRIPALVLIRLGNLLGGSEFAIPLAQPPKALGSANRLRTAASPSGLAAASHSRRKVQAESRCRCGPCARGGPVPRKDRPAAVATGRACGRGPRRRPSRSGWRTRRSPLGPL